MTAQVQTRYPTNRPPTENEIELGVRVADLLGGKGLREPMLHIDQYTRLPRRWEQDEQTAKRRRNT